MSNVLFLLSGSIACYKACDVVSRLVQRGHRVRVAATASALQFVGNATLEGLTGEPVASDLFARGDALDHISLARWADATLVCPATAHTLNRMAAGLADDLVGSLLLAHEWTKPLVVAPAMNPAMWTHPATVASVERLRGWGVQFVPVGRGRTACGEVGEGRLAEPEEVVACFERALARPERRLRVLVTSGGTAEPIDAVRVIANTSTGATGAAIAAHFARQGHEVVLLRAASACAVPPGVRADTFATFADLDAALQRWLGGQEFDAVVHAAAVSDFSVQAIEVGDDLRAPGEAKLSSDAAPVLRLRRNPKLLDTLRARSRRPGLRVVAFKLLHGASAADARQAVLGTFAHGGADFVVYNDLAARAAGGAFPAEVWDAQGAVVARCADRAEIGPALERLLAAPAVS